MIDNCQPSVKVEFLRLSIPIPSIFATNPKKEKTTSPARIEVMALIIVTVTASRRMLVLNLLEFAMVTHPPIAQVKENRT